MSRLTDYLVPDGLFLNQSAANANEVIGLLADHPQKKNGVRGSYGPAVLAREATKPTGMPLSDAMAAAVSPPHPHQVHRSGLRVASIRGSPGKATRLRKRRQDASERRRELEASTEPRSPLLLEPGGLPRAVPRPLQTLTMSMVSAWHGAAMTRWGQAEKGA